MKSGIGIIIIGAIMVMSGLILFYAIQSNTQTEPFLRTLRHAGTFIGLLGIGFTLAGILLYLINRSPPQISEDFDTK